MTVYTKTVWVSGTAPGISAVNLNKIEDGIATAHSELATHIASGTHAAHALLTTNAFTGVQKLPDGAWNAPALAFSSATGSGVYLTSDEYIALTHATDKFKVGTNDAYFDVPVHPWVTDAKDLGKSTKAWRNLFTKEITLAETTTPTAVANWGKIYTKSDNIFYFQDGAGVEHIIGRFSKELSFPGESEVAANLFRWKAPFACTLISVTPTAGVAGITGTSTWDVNKNATTMFSGTKPNLATTVKDGAKFTPSTTAIAVGDIITGDCDAIATTPAEDVTLILEIQT